MSFMKLCMYLSLYMRIKKNMVWFKSICTSKEQFWENQIWAKWPFFVRYHIFDGNRVKISIFRYTENFIDITEGLDLFNGWEIFKQSFFLLFWEIEQIWLNLAIFHDNAEARLPNWLDYVYFDIKCIKKVIFRHKGSKCQIWLGLTLKRI